MEKICELTEIFCQHLLFTEDVCPLWASVLRYIPYWQILPQSITSAWWFSHQALHNMQSSRFSWGPVTDILDKFFVWKKILRTCCVVTYSIFANIASIYHYCLGPSQYKEGLSQLWGFPCLTHWGRDKWSPFSRWHFQMHILEWKCINFDKDFTEVCAQGSN